MASESADDDNTNTDADASEVEINNDVGTSIKEPLKSGDGNDNSDFKKKAEEDFSEHSFTIEEAMEGKKPSGDTKPSPDKMSAAERAARELVEGSSTAPTPVSSFEEKPSAARQSDMIELEGSVAELFGNSFKLEDDDMDPTVIPGIRERNTTKRPQMPYSVENTPDNFGPKQAYSKEFAAEVMGKLGGVADAERAQEFFAAQREFEKSQQSQVSYKTPGGMPEKKIRARRRKKNTEEINYDEHMKQHEENQFNAVATPGVSKIEERRKKRQQQLGREDAGRKKAGREDEEVEEEVVEEEMTEENWMKDSQHDEQKDEEADRKIPPRRAKSSDGMLEMRRVVAEKSSSEAEPPAAAPAPAAAAAPASSDASASEPERRAPRRSKSSSSSDSRRKPSRTDSGDGKQRRSSRHHSGEASRSRGGDREMGRDPYGLGSGPTRSSSSSDEEKRKSYRRQKSSRGDELKASTYHGPSRRNLRSTKSCDGLDGMAASVRRGGDRERSGDSRSSSRKQSSSSSSTSGRQRRDDLSRSKSAVSVSTGRTTRSGSRKSTTEVGRRVSSSRTSSGRSRHSSGSSVSSRGSSSGHHGKTGPPARDIRKVVKSRKNNKVTITDMMDKDNRRLLHSVLLKTKMEVNMDKLYDQVHNSGRRRRGVQRKYSFGGDYIPTDDDEDME